MLFILVVIVLITSATSQTFDQYWRNCDDNSQCQEPLVCWSNKCVCRLGRLWKEPFCENITTSKCNDKGDCRCRDADENKICDEKLKQCVCRNQTVEDPNDHLCKLVARQCKSNLNCSQSEGANSFCDQTNGQCKCLPKFYFNFNDKQCRPKLSYDKRCHYHYQCDDGMWCRRDIFSSSGYCRCRLGWSEVDNVCRSNAVRVNCTVDNECRDPKICVKGICQCQSGYRLDSFGNCTLGAGHFQRCNLNSDCQSNMTCDWTKKNHKSVCQCDYGYQWSEENEKCFLFNETVCRQNSDCTDKEEYLNCTNQKCTCDDERLELTDQGTCRLKMPSSCQSNKDCPIDLHDKPTVFCNQDLKKNQCTCKQNTELSGKYCLSKRCNLEHPCHSDDYSNDDHMVCTDDGYCECKDGVDETGRCNKPSIKLFWLLTPTVFYLLFATDVIAVFVVVGLVYLLIRRSLKTRQNS